MMRNLRSKLSKSSVEQSNNSTSLCLGHLLEREGAPDQRDLEDLLARKRKEILLLILHQVKKKGNTHDSSFIFIVLTNVFTENPRREDPEAAVVALLVMRIRRRNPQRMTERDLSLRLQRKALKSLAKSPRKSLALRTPLVILIKFW